jgi:hypothetical protein
MLIPDDHALATAVAGSTRRSLVGAGCSENENVF